MKRFTHSQAVNNLSVDTVSKRYSNDSLTGKKYVAAFPSLLADWMEYLAKPWVATFTCRPMIVTLGYFRITKGPRFRHWVPGMRLKCYGIGLVFGGSATVFTAQILTYNASTGDCELMVDGITAAQAGLTAPRITAWTATAEGRPDMPPTPGNDSSYPVASGGLGISVIRSPHTAWENVGLSSPLLTVAEVFEDFLGYVNDGTATIGYPWRLTESVGGLLLTDDQPTVLETAAFFAGIATFRTLSNLDYVQLDRNNALRGGTTLANNNFEWFARVWIENLADVTNDYMFQIGYAGVGSTLGTDLFVFSGMGFQYNRAVSANWRCTVNNNNAGPTITTTGTAVGAGAWVVLGMVKTGVNLVFSVNGTTVHTATSAYPITIASTNMTNLGVLFRRTAGTAVARNIYVDYIWNRHIATGR